MPTYRFRLDLYINAESKEEAESTFETFDINRALDKGYMEMEVEEVKEG